MMGGGETNALKDCLKMIRTGGSLPDVKRYIRLLDYNCAFPFSHFLDSKFYFNKMFRIDSKNDFHPLKAIPTFIPKAIEVNDGTSPGHAYKALGFTKKAFAYEAACSVASKLFDNFKNGQQVGDITWRMGGRPKLQTVEKAAKKVLEGGVTGRALWIPDMEESVLGTRFTEPIKQLLTGNPLEARIMIGFDRTRNAPQLHSWVNKFDRFISCDVSRFDTRCHSTLVNKAFDVLGSGFLMTDTDTRQFEWHRRQFINSLVLLPNGLFVRKEHGVATGSVFTSIIGSICNFLVLFESLKKILNEDDFDILVYGDDALIGIKPGVPKTGIKIKQELIRIAEEDFLFVLDPEDTKISSERYVRFAHPIYEGDLSKGTSHFFPKRIEYLDEEPVNGYEGYGGHRWYYEFKRTWKFLSYSMKPDGTLIRPTQDVMHILANPEVEVKTLDDHVVRLKMMLLENFHNSHTRNRIFHYLYDAYWLLKNGIRDDCTRRSPIFHIPDRPKVGLETDRMWYRHSDSVYHLENEPCMQEYVEFWNNLLMKIRLLKSNISTPELWAIKRGISSGLSDKAYKLPSTDFLNLLGINPKHYHLRAKLVDECLNRNNVLSNFKDFLTERFNMTVKEQCLALRDFGIVKKQVTMLCNRSTKPESNFMNTDFYSIPHNLAIHDFQIPKSSYIRHKWSSRFKQTDEYVIIKERVRKILKIINEERRNALQKKIKKYIKIPIKNT